ncbi:hypothetical protein [Spiroplasma tabanidicola]|uniref:Uncharacterized protein n=1 Tax=Spiroplasma tabanidicola TaxID=324079 RepID=A0A6I6CAT5_9MOLU|nr:hypothetical protein [Spiroplasma tabanidicola]QGS52041.1 hypothetical protein STABA_v1c06820 [Spiroplasma tabanidicola]
MNWFGTNVSWVVIVIILVIVLFIAMFFPWQKLKKLKKEKSDLVNKPKNVIKDSKPEEEPAILSFMGIYNSIGKSEALRMKKLVYVLPKENSCELCQKYENEVLSLEVLDKKYLTMSEAISNGYHHIGCTHVDIDYYPGDTKIDKKIFSNEDQLKKHKVYMELFKLENEIRNLKYDLENKNSESSLQDNLNKKLLEIEEFCKKNSLQRNLEREEPEINELKKFTKYDIN